MKLTSRGGFCSTLVLAVITAALGASDAAAHCDGLDGPVVAAGRKALQSQDVSLALIWVQKDAEPEVRRAFERTLQVRGLSPQARELADTWFFETLVRVHRAGEGAPFTGLKPAGRDLGPVIPAADKAVENGSADELITLLDDRVRLGVRDRFAQVMAAKSFRPSDVEAGRAYVAAYVDFMHYAEGLYRSVEASGGPHAAHEDEHAAALAHPEHGDPPAAKHTNEQTIPPALKAEHDDLHAQLVKATRAGGAVGEAAQTVARRLHPHFVKEEELALPPLGLLAAVAAGDATPEMRRTVALVDRLKADLPHMLAEHKAIVADLESLRKSAESEGDQDAARLAEELTAHARTEEQVLYPAAIVLGDYLRLRFGR